MRVMGRGLGMFVVNIICERLMPSSCLTPLNVRDQRRVMHLISLLPLRETMITLYLKMVLVVIRALSLQCFVDTFIIIDIWQRLCETHICFF